MLPLLCLWGVILSFPAPLGHLLVVTVTLLWKGEAGWFCILPNQSCCSVAQSCLTVCDPLDCSTPVLQSFTISLSLLKLMSIESVMPPNLLVLCQPLLLLPSIFSSIRVFSNESGLHIRWPKDWSFSFSISPSNQGRIIKC